MPSTNDGPEITEAQQKAVENGIATRDMKWVYTASLVKKVR